MSSCTNDGPIQKHFVGRPSFSKVFGLAGIEKPGPGRPEVYADFRELKFRRAMKLGSLKIDGVPYFYPTEISQFIGIEKLRRIGIELYANLRYRKIHRPMESNSFKVGNLIYFQGDEINRFVGIKKFGFIYIELSANVDYPKIYRAIKFGRGKIGTAFYLHAIKIGFFHITSELHPLGVECFADFCVAPVDPLRSKRTSWQKTLPSTFMPLKLALLKNLEPINARSFLK